MSQKINVFHLEDYKIIRDGIRLLLAQDHQINFVGEAERGETLLTVLPKTKIDVLVLDLYLDAFEHRNTYNGFEVCERIKASAPQTQILILSAYDDTDRITKAFKAGALGFVSKKSSHLELLQGIKVVNTGQRFLCRDTVRKTKNARRFTSGIDGTLEPVEDFFSKREKEVLELLAEGYSTRDIAQKLFITDKTVESHRKNLTVKAKAKNTVELIAYASNKGVLKK